MKLEDLKKKMTDLEQTLAMTDVHRELYVASSSSAHTKLLGKFRFMLIYFLSIGMAYGLMIVCGATPRCFPNHLNTAIDLFALACGIWYAILYYMLFKIDVANQTPSELLARITRLCNLTRWGQSGIVTGFVVLDEFMWRNADSVWIMVIPIAILVIYALKSYWVNYERLFKSIINHF